MIGTRGFFAKALGLVIAQIRNRVLMPAVGFEFLQNISVLKTQNLSLSVAYPPVEWSFQLLFGFKMDKIL